MRISEPIELLRRKHLKESQESILAARRESTSRLNQPPLGAPWIREVEDSSSTESASATIDAEGTHRAVWGLREAIMSDLGGVIKQLSRLVFEESYLPESF